jgi:hypothetical protein
MPARAAYLFPLLFLAVTARALWDPAFQPNYVQVKPGQTVTISASGAWTSGLVFVPFTPMTLVAEHPEIATVTGTLLSSGWAPVQVTGLRPGVTRVRVLERGGGPVPLTSAVIVVAEETLPAAIVVEGVVAPNQTITLRAVTDDPDATFTWFEGRLGGLYATEAGTGRERTVTISRQSGVYEFWVLITSPRGAGASDVTFHVPRPPARRRSTL